MSNIDLSTYQSKEVTERIADLITFPIYVIGILIWPLLVSVVLFVSGYFVLRLDGLDHLFYPLLGLPLLVLGGFFIGLVWLISRLKDDLVSIMDYSLVVFKQAASNMQKDGGGSRDYGAVFSGVMNSVILPSVRKVLENKVILIGGFVYSIVNKIVTRVTQKYINNKPKDNRGESTNRGLEYYEKAINNIKSPIEAVVGTFRNFFIFLAVSCIFLLSIVVYLVN
ncbi:MAG: hypothetical protein ACE364_00265 [Chlorobiota bacterium]